MKYALLIFLVYLSTNNTNAQCTPAIAGDTILCPNSNGFLTSTQAYDSYQWYSRPFSGGNPTLIPGATNQQLSVTAADISKHFSVAVTLGAYNFPFYNITLSKIDAIKQPFAIANNRKRRTY